MDTLSHRIANRCVGNPDGAPTLEVTILGPELRAESAVTVAIAGADLDATIDGAPVALGSPTAMKPGATLRFGARRSGARAYVAFDGGVDAPVRYAQRLQAGDRIPIGTTGSTSIGNVPTLRARAESRFVTLRAIPGPQAGFFDQRAFDALTHATFTVSPSSNRMAYRLTSDTPIPRAGDREMISDAAFPGGVQVTPARDAILLMADRQVTGGYPQIATVVSADLPAAGQLAPGDVFRFALCTPDEARAALEAQEAPLHVH
jgi:biotin-dependent carboxylase-like uncharacterized protein